jgi:hypothetical protein
MIRPQPEVAIVIIIMLRVDGPVKHVDVTPINPVIVVVPFVERVIRVRSKVLEIVLYFVLPQQL